jgi:hypothetical protein
MGFRSPNSQPSLKEFELGVPEGRDDENSQPYFLNSTSFKITDQFGPLFCFLAITGGVKRSHNGTKKIWTQKSWYAGRLIAFAEIMCVKL